MGEVRVEKPLRITRYAPNGLPYRSLSCQFCGHHISDEAIERGVTNKKCPNCKCKNTFTIDRTDEPRNYEAFIAQEKRERLLPNGG